MEPHSFEKIFWGTNAGDPARSVETDPEGAAEGSASREFLKKQMLR
jgi:hypothetical protein